MKPSLAAKCAGAALVIALTLPSANVVFAASIQEFDENDDGVPDQWIEVIDSSTTRVSKDRNFDGIPDYELVYDERGRKQYEALDFNYDGKYDDFYYFERGVLVRREIDTDFDDQIDLWVFLSQGVYIARVERDRDGDGEVDFVIDYGLEPRR